MTKNMTKVVYGKGWVESAAELDDNNVSLDQAFEDVGVVEDSNLRLVYGLLKILKEEKNSILTDQELKALIPTIISAFVSQISDEPVGGYQGKLSFYKNLISSELTNAIESVSEDEAERERLRKGVFRVLESIKLQRFAILLVDVIQLQQKGTAAAATERVLHDFFATAIAHLPTQQPKDPPKAQHNLDREKVNKVLVEVFKRIKPTDFINQIADRLHADLQGSMTVASFTLVFDQPERFEYSSSRASFRGASSRGAKVDSVPFKHTNSPFPEYVLTAVRNEVFRCTNMPAKLRVFHQKLEEKHTPAANNFNEVSRDLLISFTELLPTLSERGVELSKQFGEQFGRLSEIFRDTLEPFKQKREDAFEDWQRFTEEVSLIFYNLDWLLFPVARYFVQDNIPGGIKYRADGQLDSDALEAAVRSNIRELLQVKPLDKEHQRRVVLALSEACYLGPQVLGEIREKVELQNHPAPYRLFLDTIVESHGRFLNRLQSSLAAIQSPLLQRVLDRQTFLKYIPRAKMLEHRSQTIFVPMTYASEEILERCQDSEQSALIRLPYCVDLSYWFRANSSNQGAMNTCTAFVVKQIIEFLYFKSRTEQPTFEILSALFLYQAAHRSIGDITKLEDSPGTSIRKVIETLVRLGIPPEDKWPYPTNEQTINEQTIIAKLKTSPSPDCYFSAQKIRITKYFRLDQKLRANRNLLLIQIKAILASGVPCMFAIKAMDALNKIDENAYVPYSSESEDAGHALIVAGYDDTIGFGDRTSGSAENQKGALLIRNSWGDSWGKGGYAWLPYEYMLDSNSRIVDCWALLEWQWMKQGNFGLALEGWQENVGSPEKPGDVRSRHKDPAD